MLIYRYILAEHIAPFFYSIGIITFIFIMDLVINMLDSILSKGIGPLVVLEFFVLNLAWMTALSVPMACLVSTLMAFGKFSADHEVTALKSSGMSLYRMMMPPLLGSAIIAIAMLLFNNTILPESNHRISTLTSDISRKKPAALLRAGIMLSDFEGYRILIGRLDAKASTMEDIKIYEDVRGAIPALTLADRGRLQYIQNGDYLQFTLYDGEIHRYDLKDPKKYFVARFEKQVLNIRNNNRELQRTTREFRGDREMNVAMMKDMIRDKQRERGITLKETARAQREAMAARNELQKPATAKGKPVVAPDSLRFREKQRTVARLQGIAREQKKFINKYLVEIHKKYSIPFACLVFVLIGAPLGVKARTGGMGVGTAYSFAFFLLYWVCLIGGENLADKDLISPFWAMWAPNFLVGGWGLFLLRSTAREGTVFSYHWMGKWAKRLGLIPEQESDTAETDKTQSDGGGS